MTRAQADLERVKAHWEARRAGLAPPPRVREQVTETGFIVRIGKRGCRQGCQWGWVILKDGTPIESGQEETEELARKAAAAELAALEAD